MEYSFSSSSSTSSSSSSSSSSAASSSSSSGLLAAAADIEAGFVNPFALYPARPNRAKVGAAGAIYAGRQAQAQARFFCESLEEEERRHFLDACFLCKKPLAGHLDIFMYRGDLPFCSEECRQQQIEMDEAKETNRKLSATASTRREFDEQKPKQKQKQSSPKSQKIALVAG